MQRPDPRTTDHDDLRAGSSPWNPAGRPSRRPLDDRPPLRGAGGRRGHHRRDGGRAPDARSATRSAWSTASRPGFGSTGGEHGDAAMGDRSVADRAHQPVWLRRAANIYRQEPPGGDRAEGPGRGRAAALRISARGSRSISPSGDGTGAADCAPSTRCAERAGLPGFYLDHPALLRDFGIAREAAILSPARPRPTRCASRTSCSRPPCRAAPSCLTARRSGSRRSAAALPSACRTARRSRPRTVVLATGYVMPDCVGHRHASRLVELGDRHAAAEAAGAVARPAADLGSDDPYFYARTTTDHRIIIGGEDDPELVIPPSGTPRCPRSPRRILRQLKTLCPRCRAARRLFLVRRVQRDRSDGLPLIGRCAAIRISLPPTATAATASPSASSPHA